MRWFLLLGFFFPVVLACQDTIKVQPGHSVLITAVDTTLPDSTPPDSTGTDTTGTDTTACAPVTVRRVNVSTGTQLGNAIGAALPNDSIVLAPGTYSGRWTIKRSGAQCKPIYLSGPSTAILNGGSASSGNGLALSDLKYWVLSGFTVTNSLAGIVAWRSSFNTISGVTVHDVGQAGIHVRENSTHNVVQGNKIKETGKVNHSFGEGVYIGLDASQWCSHTNCQPDRSDSTLIYGNTLGPNVRADLIDVKSGTTGTIVRKNTGDGAGMVTDPSNPVWVLANGNELTVDSNTFSKALTHGIKVRSTDSVWAIGSTLSANTMTVGMSGYAIVVQTPDNSKTTVKCDNVRTDPGNLTNVTCKP